MSFGELFIIGLIALIVLGPERLPKAARTVGLWIGKAKAGFNSIKTEIDRELKVQELQQQIKEQKDKLEQGMGVDELQQTITDSKENLNQLSENLTHPLNSIGAMDADHQHSNEQEPVNTPLENKQQETTNQNQPDKDEPTNR